MVYFANRTAFLVLFEGLATGCGGIAASSPDASMTLDASGDAVEAAATDPCFGVSSHDACVSTGAPHSPCFWVDPCGLPPDASLCLFHGAFGCDSARDHQTCFAGERCAIVPSVDPQFGECPGANVCVPQAIVDRYLDAGLGWQLVDDQ
jgi:hypothetical protein